LYTFFLIFHCHLSVWHHFYFLQNLSCALCVLNISIRGLWPKFPECWEIIWLVTNAFILLTLMVSSVFLLYAFLCTHTALLERLLSTVASLLRWLKLRRLLWYLSNLRLLLCSSSLFSWILHWCSCHWWWEPQKIVVYYCADIFTIWKHVYFCHDSTSCSFL